jgi:cell division septal protein FtsQ
MIKIRNHFKDFLLTNPLSRKLKIFINQTLRPMIIKLLVLIVSFLIITFISLKIFKPDAIEKIFHKTNLYFLHYLNLDNYQFEEIKITGNKRVTNQEIIDIVNSTKRRIFTDSEEYQPLIQNLIDEIKSQLLWISKITISRNMPNVLHITIEEYEPFAIWHSEDKKFIIDKDGNPVPYDEKIVNEEEFKNMIILSGRGANNHAKALFNIFAINPKLSEKIYSATWVGDRRWNIRLDNDLLVKLPEDDIYNAWQQLIKIYYQGKINDFRVIDLRINDKIYIEYNDAIAKELKSI